MDEAQLIQLIRDRVAGLTRPLIVAIDGRSGTGKSTLATSLAKQFATSVIEGDLFYAGGSDTYWSALPVKERVARVIDWQRLRAEALEPLRRNQPASFRPFDYALGSGLAEHAIRLEPTRVVILDGAYSCRPQLSEIIDLKVLITVPDDTARRQRLQGREDPAFLRSWHAIWDEAEDYYFDEVRPESAFDVVIADRRVSTR